MNGDTHDPEQQDIEDDMCRDIANDLGVSRDVARPYVKAACVKFKEVMDREFPLIIMRDIIAPLVRDHGGRLPDTDLTRLKYGPIGGGVQ